jgi:hypothetical protein
MDSYIPEHIALNVVLSVLLVDAFISIIVGIICSFFEVAPRSVVWRATKNSLALVGYSYPVALVAYIAGYLSTMGRTSAVGQIIPAVLVLISGLNLYVFGQENRYRFIISYCVCVFAGMLFYGTQYGAYKRDLEREARLKELIKLEARVLTIRKNLRLGDSFPSWVLGSEPK